MAPNMITNVREPARPTKRQTRTFVWEQMQLIVLGLTIFGQCVVGAVFFAGQALWLVANTIALIRDFKLHRPPADKIKNACLLAITCGIITTYILLG